jgi:tape measure domain-containing protein
MATEIGGIYVDLGLNSANFQKGVNQAKQQVAGLGASLRKSLGDISREFNAGFGSGILGGIAAGFSLNAARGLIDSATKISNALKVAGLSGQDLDRVYQSLFKSAQENAAPLETLVELYSRAALQQKELGVSTQQLLKFTSDVALALRVQGTDAATASGALLQLSQALGSGVVHAQEFNSILEGVPTIAQAAAAGLKEAGGSVAALRTLVVNGKVSSAAFFNAFEAGAGILQDRVASAEITVSQSFVRLQNVMIDVAGKFNEGTNASAKLAAFFNGPLTEAVREIGNVFDTVANGPIGQFVGLIDKATDELLKAAEAFGKATGLNKVGEAAGAKPYSAVTGDSTPLDLTVSKPVPPKPVTLADYPVKAAGGGSGSGSRKNAYERETQQLDARRKAIEAETAAQAALNPLVNDYGQAMETARAKQELLNAAQQAGLKITPAMESNIDDLAAKYGAASAAAERLADTQEDIRRAAQENLDAARGVVRGVIDDLRAGKSAADIFADALSKIADRLENSFLDILFPRSGSGGTAILGRTFSFPLEKRT